MHFNLNILEEISIFLDREQKDSLTPINNNLKEFYGKNVRRSIFFSESYDHREIYEYITIKIYYDSHKFYIKDGKFLYFRRNPNIDKLSIDSKSYYQSDELHGLRVLFDFCRNEKILEETMYVHGDRYGEHKVYWKNGNLKERVHYAGEEPYGEVHMDWIKDGEYERYYENGKLEIKGFYKNDKRIGIFSYYNSLGNKKEVNYDKENQFYF